MTYPLAKGWKSILGKGPTGRQAPRWEGIQEIDSKPAWGVDGDPGEQEHKMR